MSTSNKETPPADHKPTPTTPPPAVKQPDPPRTVAPAIAPKQPITTHAKMPKVPDTQQPPTAPPTKFDASIYKKGAPLAPLAPHHTTPIAPSSTPTKTPIVSTPTPTPTVKK